MGMAYMGLTHCEKCYKPLKDDEYVFCKKCEEENRKKDKSMKMKYKGYELMKAVSQGKLNLKQKVSTTSLDYKNCTIEFVLKDIAFNIMDLDFELIGDKIDIDSIEELEGIVEYSTERNTINQLVQAVKQINKEVKELENRK
jgi:predicted nucleic acid-binding Zn ribbon protein